MTKAVLTITSREISEYSDIQGLEHIAAGFGRGHGVLLLTAHLGNWEVVGARAAQHFSLTVAARPSGNAGVQNHIDAVRRAVGIQVISKYETARVALDAPPVAGRRPRSRV